MKITVTMLTTSNIFVLDVNGDIELENFKALCEFESEVPAKEISLLLDGRPLNDNKKKLNDYGVKEGDILLLQRLQQQRSPGGGNQRQPSSLPSIDFGSISMPGTSGGASQQPRHALPSGEDPAVLRENLLSNPHTLALLKERNPPLAEAVLSGSLEKFAEVLTKQQKEAQEKERQRLQLLNADPFDPDVQDKIAEEIRLKNVDTNMETAMEYAPESFGQVVMLYINVTVNGHPVKAFVDSGAQMTIMSRACAERCGIMRLVDKRWSGVAKGVGTQKIIGRVHLCQIQIGPDYLQTSFSILEDQPMDMLLGLDMLKRHQCSIDLKRNKLVIGTTGTETTFLAEGDLPEYARLNRAPEATDEDADMAEATKQSLEEATASAPSSSSSDSAPFPSDVIQRLMGYGFSRQQVLEELRRANGDQDQALAALLAKSLTVP